MPSVTTRSLAILSAAVAHSRKTLARLANRDPRAQVVTRAIADSS